MATRKCHIFVTQYFLKNVIFTSNFITFSVTMLCTSSTYLIIFASLLFNHVNLIYLETFSCVGMASSKGTTAELDSVICVRVDRPARMDSLKPKGSFCKVLAVVEVRMRMGKVEVKVKGDRVVQ